MCYDCGNVNNNHPSARIVQAQSTKQTSIEKFYPYVIDSCKLFIIFYLTKESFFKNKDNTTVDNKIIP